MKKIKSSEIKKRRFKVFKILIGLVMGVMILNVSNYVNAGINDTVIDKNRMEGVYAITNIGGVDRIFYLNMYRMNGRVSYCIDVGVDITTNIYNSTSDFGISYLTKEQIEYIRSISYFGYGYPGHDDYKFYMAAQEIIWEYLSGVEVSWSNEMSANGSKIDINSYKDEIIRMRHDYIKGIDIRLDKGEYYIGDEINIIPSSGNINDYVVSNSKYSSAVIKDGGLAIKVGNNIGREKIVLNKKGVYDYDSQLYYYDTSQRLISNGNYNSDTKELAFDIKGVRLDAMVTDSRTATNRPFIGNVSLEGFIYEVRDENNNVVGVYETNREGKFFINGLLYGKYYIKQVKPSRGYEKNDEVREFVIDKHTNDLVLVENLISNDLVLNKVYGSNGKYNPEANIRFDFYNEAGELAYIVFTNNRGYARIKILYGNYVVKQNNTTAGYSKIDDFKIEVKESKDEPVNINLVNEKIFIKLKVMTYEKEMDKPLNMEGFAYKIRKVEDNTYINCDGEDIFYTDDKGEVIIPANLAYGDYYLEQVDSPEGVILNKERYEINIGDDSNLMLVDNSLIMEVKFYNEIPSGRVIVNTFEEIFSKDKNEFSYETKVRDDTMVGLYADEDIIFNRELMFSKGDEVFNDKTDNKGKLVIDKLYLGKYCLEDRETKERNCFELVSKNNYDKVIEKKVEFVKLLEKSNIVISNVNEQVEPIEGSIFEVIDKDGDVIYTGKTNDDGVIKVNDLVNGDYCIRQRSIKGNYQLIEDKNCFVLSEDKRIDFVNKIKINKIVVPNTWSSWNGNLVFYALGLISILVGTGILVYKKIFASKLYR